MYFFVSFLAGVVFFYSFNYFPYSTAFVFLFLFICLSFKKKILLIFVLLSGTVFAFFRYEPLQDIPYIKDTVEVKGIFESYPVKTDRGTFRQSIRVKSAVDHDNESLKELEDREIILLSDREFQTGEECRLAVQFLKSRKRLNPGQQLRDDLYAALIENYGCEQKQVSLHSKIEEYRFGINTFIENNFGKDSGAFIESITTGETSHISEELRDAFNVTGLTHILSISGSHFGIFSVLLFGVFRFFIHALPYRILQRITIFLTPSQGAAILCLPFMLAYLGLSGASIPAVRSFIMIGLFLLGLLIGRKGFWLNSLLFAAFMIVLWDPEALFNLSFQLSFLAVLCIGFSISDDREEKRKDQKIYRYIKNTVLMTLSASIGTAPLVAYYFHYFSLISPLSNLLIAPFIGFLLIPLSVVLSFVYLITGHFFLTPIISMIADASISLVRLFSGIPFADIKIPAFPPIVVLTFYGGFLFYLLFNKKRYLLIVPFLPIIIYLFLSVFKQEKLNVTFIDVGQGDSSVIELPDGKTLVIDTGKTGRETVAFLEYRGKTTIDYLMLSHVHPDHTGGLDVLVRGFHVKEIWDNGKLILPEAMKHIKRYTFLRGDVIEGNGYKLYVLHPYPEFYTMDRSEYVGENNDSLVVKIEGGHSSFLFTGDIEEEAEENLLHLGRWLKSDVLKIPHHGGKTSAYESFFRMTSPEIGVISAGRDNSFGHPHQEMLDALNRVRIYRTDLDGAVKVMETTHGLESKTFREYQFEKALSFHDEMKNMKRLCATW